METSQEIKEIAEAMGLAQSDISTASKDKKNPHFGQMYATLASVWDACRGPLTKNGISVIQSPTAEGAKVTLTTLMIHKSGQWFKDSITLHARDASPQAVGSAITYARRYALSAMASVAPDDDDDGNAASAPEKTKTAGQQKGPFSHGIPFDQHKAEEAAKAPQTAQEAMGPSQQDLGTFKDFIKSGKIGKKGPLNPDTGLPTWTLYVIETEGHGELSSFSHSVFEAAASAKKTGSCVIIQSEPGKKGPVITEIEIVPAGHQNPTFEEAQA